MAVAGRPQVVIADEPTTALDVTVQAQILELLRTLCDEFGTTFMLVTHDLGEAISINTNSQSAVKPRDLRSNDKYMREIKLRYATQVPGAGAETGAGAAVVDPGMTVWVTVTFGGRMFWVWCARTRPTAHHRPSARPKASRPRSRHFKRTLLTAVKSGLGQSSRAASEC